MRARPILFSAPMVRALLDGRKTQTRRIVKPQPEHGLQICHYSPSGWAHNRDADGLACTCRPARAPYGWPGELLYVRETWKPHSTFAGMKPRDMPQSKVFYRADEAYAPSNTPWVPGIHQPRWASRLTLHITDVRVERLLDCSEADARAEGLQVKDQAWMPQYRGADDLPWRSEFPRDAYFDLWDHINGEGASEANPWVWAVSFTVLHQNVDAVSLSPAETDPSGAQRSELSPQAPDHPLPPSETNPHG